MGWTVLVIEDDADDFYLLEQSLRRSEEGSPFRLLRTAYLRQGLQRLARGGGVNLALVDLNLPDSQGHETIERVLAGSHGVPIVIRRHVLPQAQQRVQVDLACASRRKGLPREYDPVRAEEKLRRLERTVPATSSRTEGRVAS